MTAARIARTVEFLAAKYDVVVAAASGDTIPEAAEFIRLPPNPRGRPGRALDSAARVALRLAGRYERAYWRDVRIQRWLAELRAALPVDAIVVNNLSMLPLAF